MKKSVSLPYFDIALKRLRRDDEGIAAALGGHMHWGYWGPRDLADGSSAGFHEAAERMSVRVSDAAPVRDGERVLDAGCGFGGTVASLNARRSAVDLVGLNIDDRQLERARHEVSARAGNRVSFVEGDACEMPFPDSTFDVVLALECIFHFPSRERFFDEARRVLRPGGRLVVADLVPIERVKPLFEAQDLLLGWCVERVTGPLDLRYSVAAYRELGNAAGLPLTEVDDVTASTLPTFPALRRLLGEGHARGPLVKLAIGGMEAMVRLGAMRYVILRFTRA